MKKLEERETNSVKKLKDLQDGFYNRIFYYARNKYLFDGLVIILLILEKKYFNDSYWIRLYYPAASINIHQAWMDDIPVPISIVKKNIPSSVSPLYFIVINHIRLLIFRGLIRMIF